MAEESSGNSPTNRLTKRFEPKCQKPMWEADFKKPLGCSGPSANVENENQQEQHQEVCLDPVHMFPSGSLRQQLHALCANAARVGSGSDPARASACGRVFVHRGDPSQSEQVRSQKIDMLQDLDCH